MCAVWGINSSWWSVVGIILEIAGFIFLFHITIKDIMGKFYDLIVGQLMLNPSQIKRKQDLIAGYNVWHFLTRNTRRKLYVGGFLVLLSMVMQLVGQWPC